MNKRLSILTTLIVLLILCGSTMKTHAKVVGYWSFNNSEHIGKDSSPNHNHGELTDRNRAKWVWPGRVGGALQLDGGPGLEVLHDESLNLKDQLTLMCWVKFADLNDFSFGQRSQQQSLVWKSAPGGQVSYGLYANRGQLELNLPLYVNRPGVLFSWLYVIDPKCNGQFINGIPDFPARCQRKFVFGLGDSQFGNLGFRASMPGPIAAHAVHPTFFVNFFPSDNPRLNEEEQDFLKEREQDFVDILSHFMIGTSNIYLPRIMRHYEHLDKIWFHFAVVADGNRIRLYVNGREKVSERQGSDQQPDSFINSQEPLMIGTGLDGSIDEVMILDHALTEDEIKEAMELGETGRSLGFLSSVDVEITDPPSVAIPVVIPDPNLARYLRRALGLASNAPIIRQAMQQLRKLEAFKGGIKDLTGLEHATNLERLQLSENQISDVSALAGLTNLPELHLANNQISDVSPLAGLKNLQALDLWGNQISDVSPLAGLTNLEWLQLSENQISDVSPLAGLTNLKVLSLSENQISDVSPLAGLTKLESLSLDGNRISDTSPLANLTNLVVDIGIFEPVMIPDPNLARHLRSTLGLASNAPITNKAMKFLRGLDASSSGIADLTGLEHATNLEWLNLRSNQISDVSALAGLTNLQELWLGSNPISDTSVLANLPNLSKVDVHITESLPVAPAVLMGHTSWVSSVAFSPDGTTLASGSDDNTVRLWDTDTDRELRTLIGHTSSVWSVAFSPDGQRLASGSDDRTVRLWDAGTGRELRTLTGHTSWVSSVVFSPDGQRLASGSDDRTVRLWDAATGRELRTLTGRTGSVLSVVFSPDGQRLASGGYDYTVRLWDAATGRELRTLTGHTNAVSSVAFSPDGQRLASGGYDRTVRLWDAATGRELWTLTGHTSLVLSVVFSPDGQRLASGSWDGTVHLWDAATGRELRTLIGHTSLVWSLAFSPDGQRLASGNGDYTVSLWELTPSSAIHTAPDLVVEAVRAEPDTVAPGEEFRLYATLKNRGTEESTATTVHYYRSTNDIISTTDMELVSAKRDPLAVNASIDRYLTVAAPTTPGIYYYGVCVDSVTDESNTTNNCSTAVSVTVTEPSVVREDVNADGVVDVKDLVYVAERYGQTGDTTADVNGDGVVNIDDLILVAVVLDADAAAAPSLHSTAIEQLTVEDVELWLSQARQRDVRDPGVRKAILFLEQFLAVLIPKETVLLPNYPNPFNPETWIPYHLSTEAEVILTIHDVRGSVVRTLMLGHQPPGVYESRGRAAYWDGKNQIGEPVASGLYFYTLTVGEFNATRKLLIAK